MSNNDLEIIKADITKRRDNYKAIFEDLRGKDEYWAAIAWAKFSSFAHCLRQIKNLDKECNDKT